MISIFRVIKYAFQDMARNAGLSLMTVFILVLMLLSVNLLWSVKILADEAAHLIEEQVNISLYLNPAIKPASQEELVGYLKSFPEVVDLKLLKPADVLESFKQRHHGRAEMLAALEELDQNPFGPTIIIKTKESGQYQRVIDALAVPEYDALIEAKSFEGHEEALGRLQTITGRVETGGLALALFFIVISFLIIFNTIRVAIYTQRVEINIKRLVGANNWFIRGPYIVESIFFTLISLVVSGGLIMYGLRYLDPYLGVAFPNHFSLTNYYISHSVYLAAIQGAAVIGLTILSSSLAMQKHLRA